MPDIQIMTIGPTWNIVTLECDRLSSDGIALGPLQPVQEIIQTEVVEHRIYHGLVTVCHGHVTVRSRYLRMYLRPNARQGSHCPDRNMLRVPQH